MPEPRLYKLHLHGRFRLCDNTTGEEVRLRGRKSRAVIAYVALAAEHRTEREHLLGLLWGDRDESQARASLRQTVLELRSDPRIASFLTVTRTDIRFNAGMVAIDADEPVRRFADRDFELLAESLKAARDRLLPDLDDLDPAFDEWLRGEREHRQAALITLGLKTIALAVAEMQPGIAARISAALADIDDTDEVVARAGMNAYQQAGDTAGVCRCYARLVAALQRDFEIQPSAETSALHDRLLADLPRDAPPDAPVPMPPPVPKRRAELPASAPKRSSRLRLPWLTGGALSAAAAAAGIAILHLHDVDASRDPTPVVAVLPFRAVGGTDAAYAETIWDTATTDLGGYDGLKIVGQRSARALGESGDVSEIGRKLGATYLVEGSVQQAGSLLHVSIGLVRTSDAVRVATLTRSGPTGDIRALQATIGSAIAAKLPHSGHLRQPAHAPPAEAYSLYTISRGMIRSRDETQVQAAIPLLTRAVSTDPQFAAAWADLAKATWLSWELAPDAVNEDDAFAAATRFARKAIDTAPGDAGAHAVYGMLAIGVDQPAALANLGRATTLDPRNAEAWYWLGNAELWDAHYDLALAAYRRGMAIDPLWSRLADAAARLALALGRRQEAFQYLHQIELGPDRGAALCIAARFAGAGGDYATMLSRGLAAHAAGHDAEADADAIAHDALLALDRTDDAAMFGPVDPLDQQISATSLPDRAGLRARFPNARDFWRTSSDYAYQSARLLAAHRDADLVELYRRAFGDPERMRHAPEAWFSVPDFIAAALPIVVALRNEGDAGAGARLLGAARAASATIVAAPAAPPTDEAIVAKMLALSGDTERATTLLTKAFDRGWRQRIPLETDATLAYLHADVRFLALAARAADAQRRQRALAAHINLSA